MRKSILALIALLFAAAAAYFIFAEGHRENLGGLEHFNYDVNKKYCVYKIKSAAPNDSGAMANGTKICIVCRDDWPNVEVGGVKQCWSRITFISGSGVYTYEADVINGVKECYACTDAKAYYNKP